MSTPDRPLSPHIQVYRPQLTSVLSISHRLTGVALSVGAFGLTAWLLGLAAGPDAYAGVMRVLGSFLGKLVLFAFTLALYYHLCNGIRHLFWDAGYGLELPAAYASGKAVLVAAALLTLVTWGVALATGGGA